MRDYSDIMNCVDNVFEKAEYYCCMFEKLEGVEVGILPKTGYPITISYKKNELYDVSYKLYPMEDEELIMSVYKHLESITK